MRSLFFFSFLMLIMIFGTDAQQSLKYMIVPGLDSTTLITSFVKNSSGENLVATRQATTTGWKSSLIRTDSLGNIISSELFDGLIFELIPCADHGYLFTAGSALVKTDSTFHIQWSKEMTNPNPSHAIMGGLFLAQLDGNFYMLCNMEDSAFNPTVGILTTFDFILFKFDSLGNTLNYKIYADSLHLSSSYNKFTRSLIPGDHCLYVGLEVLPWAFGGTCQRYPAVVKIDTSLNASWAKVFTVNAYNTLHGVRFLPDKNIVLFGTHSGNYPFCSYWRPYIMKLDSSGNILYTQDYFFPVQTEFDINDLISLQDNSLLMSVQYFDTLNNTNNYFFSHTDQNGNVVEGSAINLSYKGPYPAFRVLDNQNGAFNACRVNGHDTLLFVTQDTSFDGCMNNPVLLNDSAVTTVPQAMSRYNINYNFILADTTFQQSPISSSYSVPICQTTGIIDSDKEILVSIFPNPSTGRININVSDRCENIEVVDLAGRIISRTHYQSDNAIINITESGLYFIKINLLNKRVIVKRIEVLKE